MNNIFKTLRLNIGKWFPTGVEKTIVVEPGHTCKVTDGQYSLMIGPFMVSRPLDIKVGDEVSSYKVIELAEGHQVWTGNGWEWAVSENAIKVYRVVSVTLKNQNK